MNNRTSEIAVSWQHYSFVCALSFVAWMLLAGNLSGQELGLGALVAVVVAALSGKHLKVLTGIRFRPMAPIHVILFLGAFFKALVLANLDLARRVLTPSLPIRPELVEIDTELQSALGRLLLTSAITLTPGTLSVDVRDDQILVHWVYCPPGLDIGERTRAIAGAFERHLKGFVT